MNLWPWIPDQVRNNEVFKSAYKSISKVRMNET